MSLCLRACFIQGVLVLATGVALSAQSTTEAERPELDYLYFKDRVEPILVETRAGQEQCVAWHTSNGPLREELPVGEKAWTNEQSRRYFEFWRELVVPGRPMDSPLLTQPLVAEAGGSGFHPGGKRWSSKADGAVSYTHLTLPTILPV